MEAERRLTELGLSVEPLAESYALDYSGAKFVSHLAVGELLYLSGTVPEKEGLPYLTGVVGADLTIEQGYEAARLTGLAVLASLKQELGELDRVTGWAKALGLVNCAPGFSKTPAVINGFTDLILELWGETGRHARSAIGASELPFDVPVEVEAIVEVA